MLPEPLDLLAQFLERRDEAGEALAHLRDDRAGARATKLSLSSLRARLRDLGLDARSPCRGARAPRPCRSRRAASAGSRRRCCTGASVFGRSSTMRTSETLPSATRYGVISVSSARSPATKSGGRLSPARSSFRRAGGRHASTSDLSVAIRSLACVVDAVEVRLREGLQRNGLARLARERRHRSATAPR